MWCVTVVQISPGHVTHFLKILDPHHILAKGEDRHIKFGT